MCDIVGALTFERLVDAELVYSVLRMTDIQLHRGPED